MEKRAQKTAVANLGALKSHFLEQSKEIRRMLGTKTQDMEVEKTETKKRTIKGKEKTLTNQDDFAH